MSLEQTIGNHSVLIEEMLRKHFSGQVREVGRYHQFIGKVYSDIEDYVLRKGQRLASWSTLNTYQGYTGTIDKKVLDVCMGIELYRHSILIHDDIVDRDNLRRGGRTIHNIHREAYGKRFGDGVATFAGNILYAMSLKSIFSTGFPRDAVHRVVQLLFDGQREVNESQVLDLLFEHTAPDVDEWYVMASRRAASLFRTTILAGAHLAGVPEEEIRILGKAASHIGYAFDIQDDLIDLLAPMEEYGRRPGGDIRSGKKPLHAIYLLGSSLKRGRLRNLSVEARLSNVKLEMTRKLFREEGALRAAERRSLYHVRAAQRYIGQTGLSDRAKKLFRSFTRYVSQSLAWYL